ncbi:LamG domain-containing protein [Streptomyces sp. NPDC051020]|uniref:LamG domain-containing protein n=1 Tax=Streptomyces sp. NPDC051020 TaxID=3155409 RepID=UPI00341906D2
MTRKQALRWSLVSLIAVLAVALTFFLVDLGGTTGAASEKSPTARGTQPPNKMQAVGVWPLDGGEGAAVKDSAGKYDAKLLGGATWGKGEGGGVLELDGHRGFVDVGTRVLDVSKDYTVAAWVRMDAPGFRTAVSLDGPDASVFFLQYVADDKRFSFSFINARALAQTVGEPELGRWYHLAGSYDQAAGTLRVYVDGKLAGMSQARNVTPPAENLVIGRGRSSGRQADFWDGGLADVRVFNRLLTDGEVASLAAERPNGAS